MGIEYQDDELRTLMCNARFFLILSVVIGHLIELNLDNGAIYTAWSFCRSITMPAFSFLAGWSTKNSDFRTSINKGLRTLIAPFVAFSILYEFVFVMLNMRLSEYAKAFAPYWILWFLPCLFVWRLASAILPKSDGLVFVAIVVALLAGFWSKIGYAFSVARLLYFFPFFVAGNSACISNFVMSIARRQIAKWVALLFALGLMLFLQSFPMPKMLLYGSGGYHAMGMDNFHGVLYRSELYLISGAGVVFLLVLVPSKKMIISSIGRNSLNINLLHGLPVLYLVNPLLNGCENTYENFAVRIAAGVILTFMLGSTWANTLVTKTVEPFANLFTVQNVR